MSRAESWNSDEVLAEHIGKLISALNSLVDGELAVTMLVACGPRAIPPLADFLLNGKPASVPEPRRRAVRALAQLGAVDVLCTYVERPKVLQEAVLRFSEETVESLAAELLSQWPSDAVFSSLMQLAKQRMLLGLCVAFGNIGRAEAIPFLIQALGDDVCSVVASDALSNFGEGVIESLTCAIATPELNQDLEKPSSAKRRLTALRTLTRIAPSHQIWERVRLHIYDANPCIAATASMVGVDATASSSEKLLLASRLLSIASQVDWLVQAEIQERLAIHSKDLIWVLNQYAGTFGQNLAGQRIAQSLLNRTTPLEPPQQAAIPAVVRIRNICERGLQKVKSLYSHLWREQLNFRE